MDKKREEKKPAPNISGSFQMADDQMKEDLEQLQKDGHVDEESMHYARVFSED